MNAADVNAEGGGQTVESIHSAGGDAVFVRADISVAADVQALIARVVELHGRLDCAYNLGVVLSEQMRLTEAAAAYTRALDLDPAHEGSLLNLAAREQPIQVSALE